MGIFIPIHPLMAASSSMGTHYRTQVSVLNLWPSELICSTENASVWEQYLSYLESGTEATNGVDMQKSDSF